MTGLFHEYELKIAKMINRHMPSVEMFRMLGSGTEAVMAAIRAARNSTGKKKIIKLGGAYHGWSDQLVFGTRIPGTGGYEAAGIPEGCLQHTQEFYPNDIDGDRAARPARVEPFRRRHGGRDSGADRPGKRHAPGPAGLQRAGHGNSAMNSTPF